MLQCPRNPESCVRITPRRCDYQECSINILVGSLFELIADQLIPRHPDLPSVTQNIKFQTILNKWQ